MIILPELKKPSKLHYVFFGVIIVWLVIVNIALIVINGEIKTLIRESDQTENAAILQSMHLRHNDLSEQLDSITANITKEQATTATSLQSLSHSVEERYSAFEQQLQHIKPDLSGIYEHLKMHDEQIERLLKPPRQSAPVAHPAPLKPAQPSAKPQRAAPAFILLGAEMRGGERLLSISPKSAPFLASSRLLRIGESVDGWELKSFDGHEATFIKGSNSHKLTLP